MSIRIERTGGFAGLTVSAEVTEPADVAEVRGLLAAPPAASDGRPDAFTYTFVDSGEGAVATSPCVLPEHAVPTAIREAFGRALRSG